SHGTPEVSADAARWGRGEIERKPYPRRRGAGGIVAGTSALEQLYAPDRNLIKQDQGNHQRERADEVGRGENRGDDGDAEDRVAPHALELRAGDNSHAAQQ